MRITKEEIDDVGCVIGVADALAPFGKGSTLGKRSKLCPDPAGCRSLEVIGGDMAKLKELTNALSGAGDKTELVFVECSLEVEIERNENRGENNISAHYAEPFHIEWIVNACEHRDE